MSEYIIIHNIIMVILLVLNTFWFVRAWDKTPTAKVELILAPIGTLFPAFFLVINNV